jgi:hypothetical protein
MRRARPVLDAPSVPKSANSMDVYYLVIFLKFLVFDTFRIIDLEKKPGQIFDFK